MKKFKKEDLKGKVIDVHSHIGLSLQAFTNYGYPYAETLESLYYKQLSSGVDINVVFPYTSEMFCNFHKIKETGDFEPAANPLSPFPYAIENLQLLREVYEYCPEICSRFLPFISVDPVREIEQQIENLRELNKNFPIYGIKINPALTQANITNLLKAGKTILSLAEEFNWPILIHATSDKDEGYSYAGDILSIAKKNSNIRFCLAHNICFHKKFLESANSMKNVWVDTSAAKILVELIRKMSETDPDAKRELIETDFSNHCTVICDLAAMYPDTIIWGTDSPAYSYMIDRKQGDGQIMKFRLKGSYLEEKKPLDLMSNELCRKITNHNTLKFIFG